MLERSPWFIVLAQMANWNVLPPIKMSIRAWNHLTIVILPVTAMDGWAAGGGGRENGRKTRWIFRNGPPEKQSQSNLRWMRLISPNNNRREAFVLLSRLAQTMAIHANPWPEPAILPMWKFLSLSIAIHLLFVASTTVSSYLSLHLYLRLYLRLPRISRWNPMMPDYRSLLEEEGKRLELGIRAAERQGEVSFAWRSLNP